MLTSAVNGDMNTQLSVLADMRSPVVIAGEGGCTAVRAAGPCDASMCEQRSEGRPCSSRQPAACGCGELISQHSSGTVQHIEPAASTIFNRASTAGYHSNPKSNVLEGALWRLLLPRRNAKRRDQDDHYHCVVLQQKFVAPACSTCNTVVHAANTQQSKFRVTIFHQSAPAMWALT